MVRFLLAFATACLLAAPAVAQFPPQPLQPPPKNMEGNKAYQQLLQDIKEARDVLAKVTDAKTRRRLENLLQSMELNARRMAEAGTGVVGPGDPFFPMPQPMPKNDFAKFLKAIQDKKFNTDRLQVLAVGDGAFFDSEQAKQIVAAFSPAGDGQRRAAIWLYGRLVDRPNFNTVLEAIPYPLERQAVLRAIGVK